MIWLEQIMVVIVTLEPASASVVFHFSFFFLDPNEVFTISPRLGTSLICPCITEIFFSNQAIHAWTLFSSHMFCRIKDRRKSRSFCFSYPQPRTCSYHQLEICHSPLLGNYSYPQLGIYSYPQPRIPSLPPTLEPVPVLHQKSPRSTPGHFVSPYNNTRAKRQNPSA